MTKREEIIMQEFVDNVRRKYVHKMILFFFFFLLFASKFCSFVSLFAILATPTHTNIYLLRFSDIRYKFRKNQNARRQSNSLRK